MDRFDYVIVGGGLQAGLLVLALRARQPEASIALIERDDRLGGNHTWCFHASDVPPDCQDWLKPLVAHRWPGYRVTFPALDRIIDEPYAGLTSDRLHDVVSEAIRSHATSELLLGTSVAHLNASAVGLSNGEAVHGTLVVDARGPVGAPDPTRSGYQKFVGLEVELANAHGLAMPILMDASVDQSEGFRFFYVLPLSPRRLLIEDTYFSDQPTLRVDELRGEIGRYATHRGWTVAEVVREEEGVLPMPWSGGFDVPDSSPLAAGYRGGWFHPGTGYSFPVALRLAEFVSRRPPNALFGPELSRWARRQHSQAAFARLLNRLLFRWYPPIARRAIFERFYRLPMDTIRNFYSMRLSWADRARLLLGRPPAGLSIGYRWSRRAQPDSGRIP